MELTCAFSGHRPEKLPWGEDESDPRCAALKIRLEQELRKLCEAGCLRYLCGMAASAVSGYFSIRLLRYLAAHNYFGGFAYYCWGAGLIALVLSLIA